MDIRLVILRTITYSLVVVLISTAIVGLTLLLPDALAINNTARIAIAIGTAVFIVLILEPLKRFIGRTTDKLFYKGRVDYDELLAEITEVINREIDINILVKEVNDLLSKGLKIKSVLIYLKSKSGGSFFRRGDEGNIVLEKGLTDKNVLINYLKREKEIIILETIERKIEEAKNESGRKALEKVKEELDRYEAGVIIPILADRNLNAAMILGPKLSGDTFSNDDINLLELLSPQLASAIEKARLYEEVKNFSLKLQDEVKKATADLRIANSELAHINEHLEQLDQAKSEFLSIASHQLRTPISGILGYLSMLLEGDFGALDPKKEKIIAELLDASRRMARMINIFLNVTRIEAGRLIVQKQETDMIVLAEAVIKELQESANKKNLSLELIKPAKKIPMVSVDQDKIKDVLGNLVDNAIKYTQAGGIKVSFEADPDYLTVAVKDTGVGIAKPEVSKLFNKFVRGSGIARIQPDGSGLGLFIAKKLTEANQGRIWVESEGQGKGTTFKFALPLKGK